MIDSNLNNSENQNDLNADIKDYLYRIILYWKWFVLTILIALALAYYKNISTQRIYGLKTTIAVKEKQNPLFSSGTNIAFNWGGVSDKVETIRRILTSRSHNEKVVKKLNYNIQYLKKGKFRYNDGYGNTPFTIVINKDKFQLLNTLIKIKFIDDFHFMISVDFEKKHLKLINYNSGTIKKYISKQERFKKGFKIGDAIHNAFLNFRLNIHKNIDELGGKVYYIKFRTINDVVNEFRGVKASGIKGTSMIELSLMGSNKAKIVDFLNMTVQELSIEQLNQKTNYARNTRDFIDKQFQITSDSLKTIESNIGTFKQKNDIYDLSVEGSNIYSETASLDKQQLEINHQLNYFKDLATYIASHQSLSKIPAPATLNMDNTAISSKLDELTQLYIEKEYLEKNVTLNHPSLILISEKIKLSRKVLLENISSIIKNTENNLASVKKRLNSFNYQLTKLPKKEQGLLNYQRKYDLTEGNYTFLMQKRYEASIAIAASVSDITILDKAKDTGQVSVLPKKGFNYMVAILLGAILPLIIIVIKELFDNKIHSVEEIKSSSSIPVLGVIGRKTTKSNLMVFEKSKSSFAESFRALRSNIQFMFKQNGTGKVAKTVMVTSSVSGEGKTLVSLNMATVFAMSNKKTILIGLDLRKPKIFGDFDISNEIGVVNYLINQKSIKEVIQNTKIPNLDAITSGPVPPNPSELIIGTQTENLIEYLKGKYDYIVIDTPPIGIVSDALELLKYADATIYVIRQNYTEKGMTAMVDQKYKKGELTNISYVLNDFKLKNRKSYGYGYGYGKYSEGYHSNERMSLIKKILKKIKK